MKPAPPKDQQVLLLSRTLEEPEREIEARVRADLPDLHLTIFAPDHRSKRITLEKMKDVFIMSAASKLPEIADLVREVNESKKLRVLFIRTETPLWLPEMLKRANLRLLRNILTHEISDWITPKRVMNAWRMGSEQDLIAKAVVIDNYHFLVLNCALNEVEARFDQFDCFRGASNDAKHDFIVNEDGSYIYWPQLDVHLNLDSIRYAIDANWRRKIDHERLIHNESLGRAIAEVRQRYQLTKKNVPGLSDRELRRIENEGMRPSVATLQKLADAHALGFDDYLELVVKTASDLKAT